MDLTSRELRLRFGCIIGYDAIIINNVTLRDYKTYRNVRFTYVPSAISYRDNKEESLARITDRGFNVAPIYREYVRTDPNNDKVLILTEQEFIHRFMKTPQQKARQAIRRLHAAKNSL